VSYFRLLGAQTMYNLHKNLKRFFFTLFWECFRCFSSIWLSQVGQLPRWPSGGNWQGPFWIFAFVTCFRQFGARTVFNIHETWSDTSWLYFESVIVISTHFDPLKLVNSLVDQAMVTDKAHFWTFAFMNCFRLFKARTMYNLHETWRDTFWHYFENVIEV
jgi:hypothetical protein